MKSKELLTLEMLSEVAEHQYVSVKGKVVSVCPIEKVNIKNSGKTLIKMDFLVADTTAFYRCVAWEKQIELFEEDMSYKFTNVTVRSFNGAKYLSIGENCSVEKIEDIGDVIDDANPEGDLGRAKVVKAEIVVVIGVTVYKSCRYCNGKVIDRNTAVGVCSKCNTKMKIARCGNHSVANVILEILEYHVCNT